MTRTLGVVCAMRAEARAFLGHGLPAETTRPFRCQDVLVCVSGVGRVGAAAAARRLVEAGVEGLVSLGVAGGLRSGLAPGDMILGEWVVEAGRQWRADPDLVEAALEGLSRQGVATWSGRVLTVEQPVLTSGDKSFLGATLEVMAVDQESGSVAEAAAQAGLPFVAIRAVCDPVEVSLPREIPAIMAAPEGGVAQAAVIARSILARPSLLGELIRLGRNYRTALNSLGPCRRVLVELAAGARREKAGCPSA